MKTILNLLLFITVVLSIVLVLICVYVYIWHMKCMYICVWCIAWCVLIYMCVCSCMGVCCDIAGMWKSQDNLRLHVVPHLILCLKQGFLAIFYHCIARLGGLWYSMSPLDWSSRHVFLCSALCEFWGFKHSSLYVYSKRFTYWMYAALF